MSLFAYSLNHHNAPLALREKMAFSAEKLASALESAQNSCVLQANQTIKKRLNEIVIVSTCNRTELYFVADAPHLVLEWWCLFHEVEKAEIEDMMTLYQGDLVAKHLFSVLSGLDSMVLGETQIVGQIKEAVRKAEALGTIKKELHFLFQRAYSVSKKVRSQTSVGANSVSMAAAAVKLATQIFSNIQELAILFVGAGEMIELVAVHFAEQTPKKIMIANRTLPRAQALSQQLAGVSEVMVLSDLPQYLHEYDIIVSSTASQLPIIGKGMVESAIKQRKHRPVFMLDLAVPRDIEGEVAELEDVFLYTLDDIASVVELGKAARQIAAEEAEVILNAALVDFNKTYSRLRLAPYSKALRTHTEAIRLAALEIAYKKIAQGIETETILAELSTQLTNQMLHPLYQAFNEPAIAGELAQFYSFQTDIEHE